MILMICMHVVLGTLVSGGRGDDASLSREKSNSKGLKAYNVVDGEFSSFPEIHQTSATQLAARGIKSLFPIQ